MPAQILNITKITDKSELLSKIIRTDSNFGRIVSVIEQHCLDLVVDSNYPQAEECAEINVSAASIVIDEFIETIENSSAH